MILAHLPLQPQNSPSPPETCSMSERLFTQPPRLKITTKKEEASHKPKKYLVQAVDKTNYIILMTARFLGYNSANLRPFYASTSVVDDSDGALVAPSRLTASITLRGAVRPPWYPPCLVLSIPSCKGTFGARGRERSVAASGMNLD